MLVEYFDKVMGSPKSKSVNNNVKTLTANEWLDLLKIN